MGPMDNEYPFRTFAACTAVLVLKMLISAFYTASRRFATRSYLSPEDARASGAEFTGQSSPEVTRALNIQRNDLENIPLFFALGLVYVLGAQPSSRGAAIYLWTFTISRVLHTVVYMAGLQPFRAIFWLVGVLTLIGMAVQVLRAV